MIFWLEVIMARSPSIVVQIAKNNYFIISGTYEEKSGSVST
jgi:hypothetical protein